MNAGRQFGVVLPSPTHLEGPRQMPSGSRCGTSTTEGANVNSPLLDWAAARRALAEQAAGGVVGIDRGRGARFSGIVWDSETLVTAAEILRGADSVTVHTANDAVPAEILACDLSVDVAVLKAKTGAPGISAAKPASLLSGDDVIIAGRTDSAAVIVWSHVEQIGPSWRSRRGGELDRLIRLSPGLHPTLEGGGAFDLEGRLCAMAVRGPRHTTLGIPSETIERVVATVLQHGRLPQPYLGVRLQSVRLDDALRNQLGRKGAEAAIVVGVEPDSSAAANLLFGDLLLSVAGRLIDNPVDVRIALTKIPIGSMASVQGYRAGGRFDASIVIRERGDR
jgi:S1-C subfamily serine protease